MIIEHALLQVRAGEEEAFMEALAGAKRYLAASPGFCGMEVSRGIESPSTFLLLVEWETIEDHTEGFRGSDNYDAWRAALHHFYEPFPVVEHFSVVEVA